MRRAVIFDFYGTLATFSDGDAASYSGVFAALGYELPQEVADAYFDRYDGVDHADHSGDADTYERWVRHRLRDLTDHCGVPAHDRERVIDALRASDQGPMVAYADAAPVLADLAAQGWLIGVCSNWGWDLDPCLEQVGLLDLVDVVVTSARAGARKPHPVIYSHTVDALGVDPGQAVFVGDSWLPDVVGPHRLGMRAVHLWRREERGAAPAGTTLEDGMHRIGGLAEMAAVLSPDQD